MLIKKWLRIYYAWKKCKFSWWEDNKEITKINSGALYYTFGKFGINYEMVQHFKSVAQWK